MTLPDAVQAQFPVATLSCNTVVTGMVQDWCYVIHNSYIKDGCGSMKSGLDSGLDA